MGPINYSIETPDVLSGIAQGFSLGNGFQQLQKQRALQQQYQTDLQAYNANPSAQGAAALALKYPQQGEAVKQHWGSLQEAERQDQSKAAGQVYAALNAGRGDIATRVVQRRIDALKNSGKDASAEENILEMIKSNPDAAKGSIGLILANVNDPKTFATQFAALGKDAREAAKLPGELAKAEADLADTRATTQKTQAEAGIKQVEAQNAPTRVALENETAQQGILNSESSRRIQELNTQIAQANSETQRGQLILERDKMVAEQGKKNVEKANEAQSQFDTVQSTLGTIDRVLNHPGLDGFFFGAGTIGGKQAGIIPGTESKDFRALIDQLTSQQFLANIKQMSGMGALSNAEGEKIAAAAGNISADQSPKQLKTTLGVIQSTLKRAQNRLVGSGNLSTTDKTFVLRSPTYGNITDGQINKLLLQNPGATREQAIQFLTQGGVPGGAGGR